MDMITFTEGELRCLVDCINEYEKKSQVLGYTPVWVKSLKGRFEDAIARFKPQVLVSQDEYMERVDTTDTEGWLQRCKCGRSFITRQRTGECPGCGVGYEILKNHEELNA